MERENILDFISENKQRWDNISKELTAMLREREQYKAFIDSFTWECSHLSSNIVGKIIKRSIKRFNDKMDNSIFGDGLSPYLTPFDCYCIFWYKDWGSCELRDRIRDTVENFIEVEYDNLERIEQLVLDYTFFTDDYKTDKNKVLETLYESFMIEVSEHIELKKIQDYLSKM